MVLGKTPLRGTVKADPALYGMTDSRNAKSGGCPKRETLKGW